MHVMSGAATLSEDPLPHAVAVLPLAEAVQSKPSLPEGSQRFVVSIDGTESDDVVSQLQVSQLALLPAHALLPARVK